MGLVEEMGKDVEIQRLQSNVCYQNVSMSGYATVSNASCRI